MSMIKGKSIIAMSSDYTSVKEMLQVLGVEPTEEMIKEATESIALQGGDMTMTSLYNFLKTKKVMSKNKSFKLKRVADIRTNSEVLAKAVIDLR